MKLQSRLMVVTCVAIGACLSASAFAADMLSKTFSKPSIAEPSQLAPPLPEMQAPLALQKKTAIPPLPLSVPCRASDVLGVWSLRNLYEDPSGVETQTYNVSPIQYIFFRPDGLYGKYNGAHVPLPPKKVVEEIKKHTTGLQQYLVQDSGMIYYYLDKVAIDVQACFIVIRDQGVFPAGDMLLMPPKGESSGRLIKQYTHVPPVNSRMQTNVH